jgi:hypothetical protein
MSPPAQAAHGFLTRNDRSLWASYLADLLKSVCYLTAELEAVDGDFDTPILQSRLAANDQPKQRAEAQDRLKARLIKKNHNPHPEWQNIL